MRFFTLICLLLSVNVQALDTKTDVQLRNVVRHYPIGFFVATTLGQGIKLWEKKPTKPMKVNPLYGYIRPSLTYQTSFVVNGARAQFDIFPISILGGYIAYDRTWRHLDQVPTFDCEVVECRGKMIRKEWGIKMAIGAKGFFGMGHMKWTDTEMDGKNKNFADERTALILLGTGDTVRTHEIIIGKNITDKYAIALAQIHSKSKNYLNDATMHYLFTKYQKKDLAILVGPGVFSSRQGTDHFSALMLLQWNVIKGYPLI